MQSVVPKSNTKSKTSKNNSTASTVVYRKGTVHLREQRVAQRVKQAKIIVQILQWSTGRGLFTLGWEMMTCDSIMTPYIVKVTVVSQTFSMELQSTYN